MFTARLLRSSTQHSPPWSERSSIFRPDSTHRGLPDEREGDAGGPGRGYGGGAVRPGIDQGAVLDRRHGDGKRTGQETELLSGAAEFNDFDVKLQGIELKSSGPIRANLRNGIATLEQLHITGQDTDLQASGTAQVFGATGPNGGKLDIRSNGSVSVAIVHTLDPDIISSGKVSSRSELAGR